MKTVVRIGLSVAALATAACNDEAKMGIPDLTGKPAFAVHLSDYASAGVALIDGDGKLLEPLYLSSGTQKPGLNAALHSDIALPTRPCDPGMLTVIARQGADYLLQVDLNTSNIAHEFKLQQEQDSVVFASNPQDILCFGDGRALVPRASANLMAPAGDLDAGDDLILVDLDGEKLVSRVDLSMFHGSDTLDGAGNPSGKEAYAAPGNIVRVGDYALVGLSRYSPNFEYEKHGALALVDLDDLSVKRVDLEKLANCGSLVPVAGEDKAVIVQCAGVPFGDPETSGLLYVSVEGGKAKVEHTYQAKTGERQIYASVTSVGGTRVVAVSQDYVSKAPDTAYVVDLATGSADKLFEATMPGDIGSGVARIDTGLVLIPDASAGVRVFGIDDQGKLTERDPIALDPALPARTVRALVDL